MEDEPTVPDAEAEAEATNKELTEAAKAVVESAGSQGSGSTTDSDSSINNKSSESFTDTISADSSMNAKEESELNNQLPAESEAKIVDLITDSKWSEAIKAYRIHKTRWPGTLPILASQVIGNTSDDDDIGAMLNLFCAALAEKSAGIFVMTLTDMDIAESCSRLMEAIQQLSQTIKQLESFHVKQQQQKLKTIVTSPMGGPPPLPSLPASTQSLPAQAPAELPVSPSVPVADTAVASASTAAPPAPAPVSKSPPPAPQFDGKIQPAIIEETTVDLVSEESAVLPQAEETEVTETEITQPLIEAISPLPTTEAVAASPPLPTISEPNEENYINKEESKTVSPVPTVQEITEGVPAVVPEVSEVPIIVEEVVPEVPTEPKELPKEVPKEVPEVPAVVPKVEDEVVETSNIQSDL